MVETETRSNRRLAGFRTICAHAYILVVVQRAQRLKFGQILLSTDMCQLASSYASSKTNVQKIQPACELIHSIMRCVGGLNFLYIHFAWCV